MPRTKSGNGMIFARQQIQSLIEAGITAEIFFLNSRLNPLLLLKDFFKFFSVSKKFNTHIIHAHYGTVCSFFSALCAFFLRLPLVITFHGSDINNTAKVDGFWRDLIGRTLSQISSLSATRIICVSKKIKEKLWWSKKIAAIIPVGVNTDFFYPVPKNEARQKLNISSFEKIILFNAGKNPEIKRIDIAREVFQAVKKNIPEARMEILDGNVAYDKIPFYMNAADCLLLTSDSEGSPTIVKESLMCNLPVVSVDAGDVEEQLDGIYPSKIVSRDLNQISNAVSEILYLNQNSNGRTKLENYSDKEIAKKIKKIYSEIIQ
ncbi:MAG: glycosyltransferase [Bacteroidetes bacterium]|nr:glycosyltransferase [Bacteroidota bacterium]